MKTFDELFKEAAAISDRRNKVLFQLVSKTEKEIFPEFSKLMGGFGLKECFFSVPTKPFCGDFLAEISYGEEELWHFGVKSNGCIDICKRDDYTGKYSVKDTYKFDGNENEEAANLPVITFTRVGILTVLNTLNKRMEELNTKYTEQTETAETMLNSK